MNYSKKRKRKVKKKAIKKSKKKTKKKAKKKLVGKLKRIQSIHAVDIPHELTDACLDINDEFPLHYSNGIVCIKDDGNPVAEFLKTVGFEFDNEPRYDEYRWAYLAVWGT